MFRVYDMTMSTPSWEHPHRIRVRNYPGFPTNDLIGKHDSSEDGALLLQIAEQDPASLVGLQLSGMLGSHRTQFSVCGIEENKIQYLVTTRDGQSEKKGYSIESLKYMKINLYRERLIFLFEAMLKQRARTSRAKAA